MLEYLFSHFNNFFFVFITICKIFNFPRVIFNIIQKCPLILILITVAILNKLVKKGLLGRINKILGIVAGGMFAMITACIVSNIAYKISPEFADGAISVFFRNINPFAVLMKI